eukprot:symbB.v1.2.020972.t3/scaffold1791.1/size101237/12
MEIMVQTIRKLEGLKRDTSDARQKYLRVLEHISDASNELVDHALRVTMLLVSDQHAEFEQLVAKEGPMTLKLLSKPYFRHNSVYWATDLGQVLQAALVRSDPQRFKPTGTGDLEIDGQTVTAARVWSLWTDELRTVKRYEYSSPEEARQVFETCRCCTVLVGPEGKIQEKSLAAGQMLQKVLQEDSTLRELNRRVDQHIHLQRGALGLPPPKAQHGASLALCLERHRVIKWQVTAIEDFLGEPATTAHKTEEQNNWHNAVQKAHYDVQEAWMANHTEIAGVAADFRGPRKVKWVEGVFEKESKSSDFPTIILDLSKTFSDLLCCHKEVMSAVRGMISEGGSKEALAAIYALRQKSIITGQLDGCMQRFMASANLLHGFYEHLFFDGLETNKKIKGQTAPIQRLYFESIRACSKIRDDILTHWHKLGLQAMIGMYYGVPTLLMFQHASFQHGCPSIQRQRSIDMTERAAFCQLMGMPSPTLALTGGSPLLQLPDEKQAGTLAVAFIAVQLTIEARTEKLPGVVETAMYLSCFALFLQAIVCIITPFITNSELKVVRGTVETPDMVDFATGHPQMFSLMSGIRWICTAILYVGVAITCAYLWSQKDAPAWVILVMHLITYFFTVHFFLWLCFTLRSVNGGSMDALRTLTTAKDTVAICPMLALLFIECWVAALDLTTPSGARGVPQGYGQDYMFVATWALLIQLVMCVANGFVFSLPKDLQVMKVFGNSVRGGLSAIWFVYYLAMVTVYASILIVFMARYTNKSSTASGTGAWFAW